MYFINHHSFFLCYKSSTIIFQVSKVKDHYTVGMILLSQQLEPSASRLDIMTMMDIGHSRPQKVQSQVTVEVGSYYYIIPHSTIAELENLGMCLVSQFIDPSVRLSSHIPP